MTTRIQPGWSPRRRARAWESNQERLRRLRAEYAAETAIPPQVSDEPMFPAHPCDWCEAGVHTLRYGADGVARCACCKQDMTSEKFPRLELKK